MQKTDRERAIALAGIFQATALVRDVAYKGQVAEADFAVCLRSILCLDAPDVESVYGGLSGLRRGLTLLADELRTPREMELARYTVNLLVLERKLSADRALLQRMREGIEAIAGRLDHFALTHENIVAALAELYSQTISKLTPRIMVNGDPAHLNRSENADRIRALLLAGIRSAVLWRQAGGGRLTLLLRRNALLREARRLLGSLPH